MSCVPVIITSSQFASADAVFNRTRMSSCVEPAGHAVSTATVVNG